MFSDEQMHKLIKYWVNLSDYDWNTTLGLFNIKRYPHSLFFLHLSIEKLLKALIVKKTNDHPPNKHNLVHLIEKASLAISEERLTIINSITAFNIEARYPDYKKSLYKKADKRFTYNFIERGKEIRKWLKEELKN